VQQKRRSALGYWGWVGLILLVVVIGIFLLYAYRAYTPAV
jgi:hypothetical protein